VLGNLVQNSLTHTGSSVKLNFSAKKDGNGVLLTVADNGPGIPPEYHELIFRKFERVKNPNIPRTRSSGLGLAFCKLVTDAHGGRIWVQSPGEGQGSSFHIYLPVHPPAREVKVSGGALVAS
jgi:signal transduction histidine kinase